MKLEVHFLATGNLKSFPVLGLWPQVESLSVSNLFSVRSVVLCKIRTNQLNEFIELEMKIENEMSLHLIQVEPLIVSLFLQVERF